MVVAVVVVAVVGVVALMLMMLRFGTLEDLQADTDENMTAQKPVLSCCETRRSSLTVAVYVRFYRQPALFCGRWATLPLTTARASASDLIN